MYIHIPAHHIKKNGTSEVKPLKYINKCKWGEQTNNTFWLANKAKFNTSVTHTQIKEIRKG